jgi:hypothetical protein
MRNSMKRAVCLGLILSLCASVQAAQNSPQRVRTFAALPDWTGLWEAEAWVGKTVSGAPPGGLPAVFAKASLSKPPPYNAEWAAKYQAGLKQIPAYAQTGKNCFFPFPMAMESPPMFQVVVTPEETLFIFESPDIRHIYTDGRPHPPKEEIWPTRMGWSIGRWEGDTLVVQTIARDSDLFIAFGSPASMLSEQARFTERIRMIDKDQLENVMTVEDPVALAKPWTVTLKYRRVTDVDELPSFDCSENDRNPVVDGKLTIAPPR